MEPGQDKQEEKKVAAEMTGQLMGNDPIPQSAPYPISAKDAKMIDTNYVYHSPKENQNVRYDTIRGKAGMLAGYLLVNCPPSRERAVALTKEEAMKPPFWNEPRHIEYEVQCGSCYVYYDAKANSVCPNCGEDEWVGQR